MADKKILVGENLSVVQDFLVNAMDEIHRICLEEGIEYYMIGGSALGAVRHKGFIPWDVDIDIAMHREHYDKFAQIAEHSLPENMSYHCHRNTKKYYRPHATVVINNVKALLDTSYYRKPKVENLFIDIFPLDNAPDDEMMREQQSLELRKLIKIHSRKECVLYRRNSFVQVAIKRMIQFALIPYSLKMLEKKRDAIMTCYDNIETKCWCSMVSHYPYKKQCMPKEIYGTPRLMKFEEREFYVPENIEDYLERIFGKNYMQLPPVEKRVRPDDVIEFLLIRE